MRLSSRVRWKLKGALPVHDLAADRVVDIRVIHDGEGLELALDSGEDANGLLVVIASEDDLRLQQQAEMTLSCGHAFGPAVQRIHCRGKFGHGLWYELYRGWYVTFAC